MSEGFLYVSPTNPGVSIGPPPKITLFPDPSQPPSDFVKITAVKDTTVTKVSGKVDLKNQTASPILPKKTWDTLQTNLASGKQVEVKIVYDANSNITSFASQTLTMALRLSSLARVTTKTATRLEAAHEKLDEIREILVGGSRSPMRAGPPPKSSRRPRQKRRGTVRKTG